MKIHRHPLGIASALVVVLGPALGHGQTFPSTSPAATRHRHTFVMRGADRPPERTGLVVSGYLDLAADGVLRLSTPIDPAMREAYAKTQRLPLDRVPTRNVRSVYFDTAGDLGRKLAELVGQEVELEVSMNGLGFFHLVQVRSSGAAPKRSGSPGP